jgi:hypothetical protein
LKFQTNSVSFFPLSKESQQSQYDFFYPALSVLGVVPARAVTSVDPTHSTPDNDAIVVDTEGIEDDEDLIDYNEELEEEAAREREAKGKCVQNRRNRAGNATNACQRAHQELFCLSSCNGGHIY